MNFNGSKEETFSGLEIRNKPSSGNNQETINPSKTNNGFVFLKGKANQNEQPVKTSSNKELINVFGNGENSNEIKNMNSNNSKSPNTEIGIKQGFTFLKSGKAQQSATKDELSSVFQDLNNVSKTQEKSVNQLDNINKSNDLFNLSTSRNL